MTSKPRFEQKKATALVFLSLLKNIPYGNPVFAKLSDLDGGFVKDDSIL